VNGFSNDKTVHLLSGPVQKIYENLVGAEKPSFAAFDQAITGFRQIYEEQKLSSGIITLIDYTLSSDQERLWVIDLTTGRILHHSLVAHGRNSGNVKATSFSDLPNSNKSSVGFFLTAETYFGKHGYSLRLDGLEKGWNQNARRRAIVMHPADYATTDFIKKYGRLGRSLGCPALPPSNSKAIVDTIKDGTVLFIYNGDRNYFDTSEMLIHKT
jgi:hypothetical protein